MVSAPSLRGTSFQGKYPEEEYQFYFRQHWLRLFPAFARMLMFTTLLVAAAFVILGSSVAAEPGGRHLVLLIFIFIFLFVQFEFLERFYNHFLYIIVVTDRRVHRIKKTLFVTDDQQSTDLWVIQDINKSQHGLVQVALGFGSLLIEAQETTLKIHFVPGVGKKYEQLMHLREKARKLVQQGSQTDVNGASTSHPYSLA